MTTIADQQEKRLRRTKIRKVKASESQVLRAVLKYLRHHPKVAWAERFNAGAAEGVNRDGSRRFIRMSFTGCSDIGGQMKDGRALWIETKAPGGRLTDGQRVHLERVQRFHGVAGVATSIDDVDDILQGRAQMVDAPKFRLLMDSL